MSVEQRLTDLVCCFMIEKKVGRAVFSFFFFNYILFLFILRSQKRLKELVDDVCSYCNIK